MADQPKIFASKLDPSPLPASGLYSVDAYPKALTDRQLINALVAKLGGMVTITPDEAEAALARSVLQFDTTKDGRGIVISLLPDR